MSETAAPAPAPHPAVADETWVWVYCPNGCGTAVTLLGRTFEHAGDPEHPDYIREHGCPA